MKRQTIYELIKAHFERDDGLFEKNAKKIAKDIKMTGDDDLYNIIKKMIVKNTKVQLPRSNNFGMIMSEYQKELLFVLKNGISNGKISNLFIHGRPGSGKTLFISEFSKTIGKNLKIVHLSEIIDSKFGESIKNLENIFSENKGNIIFIDEVDSIASSRRNSSDIFEINRILNTLLKIIDDSNSETFIACATNMFDEIDPAFKRRFHTIINFDIYPLKSIREIWKKYSIKYSINNESYFNKFFIDIIDVSYDLMTPSSLENIARIVSLWAPINKIPFDEIREILKQINITKEELGKRKIKKDVIKYFFRELEIR